MQVRYISLDSAVGRDLRMRGLLTRHGLGEISQRAPGIQASRALNGMSMAETGCLLAHHSILTSLEESQTTVVLEDDVVLCIDFAEKIGHLTESLEASPFDIVFLGQTISYEETRTHARLLKLLGKFNETRKHLFINAHPFYRFGAFAYAINRQSVRKVHALLSTLDLPVAAKPIDSLLKDWISRGLLKAAVIFPYLAGVDASLESSMQDRSGPIEHRTHAEIVNLYLDGYAPDARSRWETVLSGSPDLHALEICLAIYGRLTRQ